MSLLAVPCIYEVLVEHYYSFIDARRLGVSISHSCVRGTLGRDYYIEINFPTPSKMQVSWHDCTYNLPQNTECMLSAWADIVPE
jgi:hypothetical protein